MFAVKLLNVTSTRVKRHTNVFYRSFKKRIHFSDLASLICFFCLEIHFVEERCNRLFKKVITFKSGRYKSSVCLDGRISPYMLRVYKMNC